jgi:hypothetical protein
MAIECRLHSFDFGNVDCRATMAAFDGGVISSAPMASSLRVGGADVFGSRFVGSTLMSQGRHR